MDMITNNNNNKQNESSLQKTLNLLRRKRSDVKKSLEESLGNTFGNNGSNNEKNTEAKESKDDTTVQNKDEQGNNSPNDQESVPKSGDESANSAASNETQIEIEEEIPQDFAEGILDSEQPEEEEQEPQPPQDAQVLLTISQDKMSVYMVVEPPLHGGQDITAEMINQALEKHKVCHGVKQEEIDAVVAGKRYNHEFIVAEGTPPIHGKNGEILELKLRDTKQNVHKREDGTIDFKNLGAVNAIKEGEKILKIVPPEEGVDGTDVLGRVLRGKNGKNARVDKGENTKISDDGEHLVATCDGDLKFSKSGFSVSKIFTVQGNLDNSVGNLEFIGDVDIKGDVIEGFSITAKGNVNVGGMVEGASITAGGNITIRNGINGMGSGQLYAGGEIRCKFIENSTIIAKGDIYAESIINSSVSSHASLFVAGRRGTIIGGRLTIQKEIEAKIIGSQFNVPTEITLGAPPEMLEKRTKLMEELTVIDEKIKKIDKDICYLLSVEENRGLTQSRKNQLAQLKISKPLEKMRAQRVKKLIAEINDIINHADRCKLSCQTIHPAVKISIRDSTIITKITDSKSVYMYIDGEVKKLQG